MCGIIGYIGNNAKNNIINSLKKLEYRGYDSSGIALLENNNLYIIKEKGYIENMEKKASLLSNSFNIGIGHTRWATTGKVSKENSHPHSSQDLSYTIVHNGIIDNYREIKQELSQKGYKFKSHTDSEVIANLLQEYHKQTNSVIENIELITKKLKGTYALAILYTGDNEHIYVTKNEMPLFITSNNEFSCVSSAVLGFPKQTQSYIMLENKDIAKVSLNSAQVFNNAKKVERKCYYISQSETIAKKNNFKHFMLKEIFEIPSSLENTINIFNSIKSNQKQNILNLFNKTKRIHLIGCGTAYHSCLVGEYILRTLGYDTTSHIASEFKYFPPILNQNSLCIFVSQSGETADTLGALKIANSYNVKTLAITNSKSSTLAHICDNYILLGAGPEIAVASTKAYNCQCLVFYLLKQLIIQKNTEICINSLSINNILQETKQIRRLAKSISSFGKVFFIGRGQDSLTAMEGSLKLKEVSYISSESYPAGELKHGTLALIDKNSICIIILTHKSMIDKVMNSIMEIHSRGGSVLIITPFKELKDCNQINYFYYLPILEKEEFYPLISVIPLQFIAYFTSVFKGNNPDKPRNLAKSVTVE